SPDAMQRSLRVQPTEWTPRLLSFLLVSSGVLWAAYRGKRVHDQAVPCRPRLIACRRLRGVSADLARPPHPRDRLHRGGQRHRRHHARRRQRARPPSRPPPPPPEQSPPPPPSRPP